jgi:DNA-binding NarL/FixJ family response regulator
MKNSEKALDKTRGFRRLVCNSMAKIAKEPALTEPDRSGEISAQEEPGRTGGSGDGQGANLPVLIASEALSKWKGLSRCFSKDHGFVLVLCPDNPDESLVYARKLMPSVLIVDGAFFEDKASLGLAKTVGFGSWVRVLVYAERDDQKYAEDLLRLGCMGFVKGPPTITGLRRSVRAVAAGELWASRKVVSRLMLELLAESPRQLTDREREILKLIGQGLKNQEIADRLFISRETVRWHMRSLYAKLGVQDRLAAALYAVDCLPAEVLLPAKARKSPSRAGSLPLLTASVK